MCSNWRCGIATEQNKGENGQAKLGAREFAIEAARLAANTRCGNVVVLDVRQYSPITDYFVLATGTSARQMRTVCDETAELGEGTGFKPLGMNGYEGESWILADFVDVILHVFSEEARQYYDLDNLWGDAPRVDWRAGMVEEKPAGR